MALCVPRRLQPEEALKSAVEEFAAQGVNLSNIIQTASGGDISQHPAAQAVQELEDKLAEGDVAGMAAAAAAVAAAAGHACGSGGTVGEALAVLHRAGATGALARSAAACTGEPSALADVLRATADLMGGTTRDLQADFLQAGGIEALQAALGAAAGHAALAAAALQAAAASAAKNENGKAACMAAGLGSSCLEVLRQHPDQPEALQAACAVLSALTTADDDTLPSSRWGLLVISTDVAGLMSLFQDDDWFSDAPCTHFKAMCLTAGNCDAICLVPCTSYAWLQGLLQCPPAGQRGRSTAAGGSSAQPRPPPAGSDHRSGQRPAAGERLMHRFLPRFATKSCAAVHLHQLTRGCAHLHGSWLCNCFHASHAGFLCCLVRVAANDEICQEVAGAGGVQLALQVLEAGRRAKPRMGS